MGGSMAEAGAVTWNFEPRGVITVSKEGLDEEELFENAIEAGADDVDAQGDCYEIYTASNQLHSVAEALEGMGVTPEEVKLTMEPKTLVDLEGKLVTSNLRLLEALEDNDDVQNVYSNLNITDEAMAEAMAD